MFLHGVVGEVDHAIAAVVQTVFLWWGANVAVIVPISLQSAVYSGDEDVAPDVELPSIDQETILYVLLHNNASLAILEALLQLILKLSSVGVHSDAEASIWVLSWLDDPKIVRRFCHFPRLNSVIMP